MLTEKSLYEKTELLGQSFAWKTNFLVNYFENVLSQRLVYIFKICIKFSSFLIPNMTYFLKKFPFKRTIFGSENPSLKLFRINFLFVKMLATCNLKICWCPLDIHLRGGNTVSSGKRKSVSTYVLPVPSTHFTFVLGTVPLHKLLQRAFHKSNSFILFAVDICTYV